MKFEFSNDGDGWVTWIFEAENSVKFSIGLSNTFTPFLDLHQFFKRVLVGEDASVEIDEEGRFCVIEVAPAKYEDEHMKDMDGRLSVRQEISEYAEASLKNLPVNRRTLVGYYMNAFNRFMSGENLKGWAKEDLYLNEYNDLRKCLKK